ncbi:hypothetical protein BV22DRAFT_1193508 [Leucogyrophana mollusca]|uniref:Uncharacterized protein n=1 Tax=Leucogyrophana mollusca TaxID=85980 RepID=A0ACB8BPL5_9AGAM|nr:hypothetical protein BV22DRAFT_1193508 [Leucogyrophana mollusca]
MFSSFSSFLPSVLQTNPERTSHQSLPQREDKGTGNNPGSAVDQGTSLAADGPAATKKKDKKDKHANETFIVVRPPPSKSNHPLNLQVQLVPPHSRHDRPSTIVQSLDTSAHDSPEHTGSTDLKRTTSNRSDASGYSGYTSAASISSFASTSTTSSGRRMIIPLYNLQAHNVMTNIIVDAGTDAKVAKFAKRGLEIVGLAVLEPIEVWGSPSLPGALPGAGSARTSVDDGQREFGLYPRPPTLSTSRPVTPERPSTSHSVSSRVTRELSHKPSVTLTPPTPESSAVNDALPQRGAKRLFTKMFKKKETTRSLPVSAPAITELPGAPGSSHRSSMTARQSRDFPLPGALQTDESAPSSPMTGAIPTLCPPVLGIQPALYPPIFPPKGRPTMYVWVVRKWLKGSDNGILNGMMGKLSVNSRQDLAITSPAQVEVRFEWSRGRKKTKERGRKAAVGRKASATGTADGRSVSRRRSAVVSSNTPSTTSLTGAASPTQDPSTKADSSPTNHRQSTLSHHSSNSDTATSLESSAAHHREDSGDESDPEDSETPWSCTLSVQRLRPTTFPIARAGSLNDQERSPVRDREHAIRLKVAMLSPTPHHPKVVGLLKVPFPLPDIEVEKLAIRKRVVTAQGVSRTVSNAGELVLTAEEIKDSISSTALWLVVREAFGGVGRERRKGDGWRIRA